MFQLCSGFRNSSTLQIPIIISIDGSFITCTTCIVYQYFKELASDFHFSKADAKVKTLFLTAKFFRSFFYLQALCRHPLSCERKSGFRKAGAFPCGSDCKDKNFIQSLPNFYGSFFSAAPTLRSSCQSLRFHSLGKRVQKQCFYTYQPNLTTDF